MKKRIITAVLTGILIVMSSTTVFAQTFTQADYPTEWTFSNGRTVQTFFDDKGNFVGRQENGIIVRLVSKSAVHLPNSYNGGIASETAAAAPAVTTETAPAQTQAQTQTVNEQPIAVMTGEEAIEYMLSPEYVTAVRDEFYALVNEHRVAHGLAALEVSAELEEYADIRAAEQRERFGHTRPDGSRAGSGWHNSGNSKNSRYAENAISTGALSPDPACTALGIFSRWKNSPGHNSHMIFSFDPHIKMAFGIVPILEENGFVTSGAIFATGF